MNSITAFIEPIQTNNSKTSQIIKFLNKKKGNSEDENAGEAKMFCDLARFYLIEGRGGRDGSDRACNSLPYGFPIQQDLRRRCMCVYVYIDIYLFVYKCEISYSFGICETKKF